MDSPHTPLQHERQEQQQQQQQEHQQQQQQQADRSIRSQSSSLSTSSIGSAATFIASPLSPFHRSGASAYQPITGISEDYMTSYRGAGAEKQRQQDQQQSPSPSLQQQHQEFSPVSPSSIGSGYFAGYRPQGLGLRYNNSGAAKMVKQGPPPVSRGNVTPRSPDEGGEAGGFFRGLESHLEEAEEGERKDNSIEHKRAASFGTLDSGRAYTLLLSFRQQSPPLPSLFILGLTPFADECGPSLFFSLDRI